MSTMDDRDETPTLVGDHWLPAWWAAHIRDLVKTWPPLTDDEVETLRALLPPVREPVAGTRAGDRHRAARTVHTRPTHHTTERRQQ